MKYVSVTQSRYSKDRKFVEVMARYYSFDQARAIASKHGTVIGWDCSPISHIIEIRINT